jgi:hypothetical protein|nr:MAG TPA: hypothetical protein [Caudoviricetes sp.]DAR30143.1 MAG TPA: hypothetical protein [Caudoviricetes sp.]
MGDNNNGWSFLDTLTVFSVLLQMMGYQSDQKQASNDDILRELQRQNMDYLEKITAQQKKIMEILSEMKSDFADNG